MVCLSMDIKWSSLIQDNLFEMLCIIKRVRGLMHVPLEHEDNLFAYAILKLDYLNS